MAAIVESDLVALLNGVGGLVDGTNLFRGPVRPAEAGVPAQAVFVLPSGGPGPRHHRNGLVELRKRAVQVRVRSNPREFSVGKTLAELVLATLHRHPPAGYVELEVVSSQPLYLGADEEYRHEWSLNFIATIDE